jgi:hypothetical protein
MHVIYLLIPGEEKKVLLTTSSTAVLWSYILSKKKDTWWLAPLVRLFPQSSSNVLRLLGLLGQPSFELGRPLSRNRNTFIFWYPSSPSFHLRLEGYEYSGLT